MVNQKLLGLVRYSHYTLNIKLLLKSVCNSSAIRVLSAGLQTAGWGKIDNELQKCRVQVDEGTGRSTVVPIYPQGGDNTIYSILIIYILYMLYITSIYISLYIINYFVLYT
jgi:hypothetical protein